MPVLFFFAICPPNGATNGSNAAAPIASMHPLLVPHSAPLWFDKWLSNKARARETRPIESHFARQSKAPDLQLTWKFQRTPFSLPCPFAFVLAEWLALPLER